MPINVCLAVVARTGGTWQVRPVLLLATQHGPQQLDPDVLPLWRGDLVLAIPAGEKHESRPSLERKCFLGLAHVEVNSCLLLLQATEPRLAPQTNGFAGTDEQGALGHTGARTNPHPICS